MARLLCYGICALTIALCSHSAQASRSLLEPRNSAGRRLLDVNLDVVTSPFNLTAFGTGGNCYLQGYPGSRSDQAVAGPLTVKVYAGQPLTIGLSPAYDTYYQNYNYSGSVQQTKVQQTDAGWILTFSPTSASQSVNVFSGLVTKPNPPTQPTCIVNITFTAVAPPPPPPPPSPPPINPGQCTGAVPCYCQNGYCFNNGATLTTSCKPPGGQSCSPVTINPAILGAGYAYGYGSSVTVCQCTSTAG